MCSRLETLVKAGLPYFPVVLIKSTNYFHASIPGLSFDAWKFLRELKKKLTDFGNQVRKWIFFIPN